MTEENGWVILRNGALGWRVGTEYIVEPGALDAMFKTFELPFNNGPGTRGKISLGDDGNFVLAAPGAASGLELKSANGLLTRAGNAAHSTTICGTTKTKICTASASSAH